MQKTGKTWSLWALIVLAPAVAIAISTYYVFPESFKIIGIMLIISVGVSAWVTHNSDEPVQQLRRFGLMVKFALAVVLFANLAVHVQVSRELSGAKDAVAERREADTFEQDLKDREARRQALAAESRSKELAALAAQQKAQRNLLLQLPVEQRRYTPPAAALSSVEQPATPDPLATPAPEKSSPTAAKLTTPEQVRDEYSGWMFTLALIEALIAVVGGARLLVMLHWDQDGNGVPDWVQQLPEAEIRRRFPHFVPVLFPNASTNQS